MTKTTATILGFITVPIIPGVFIALGGRIFDRKQLLPVSLMLIGAYLLPALFAALLGVPSFLLLRRFGLIRPWSTAVVGFCIGDIFAVIVRLPISANARDLIAYGAAGALSAFIFWLTWKLGDEPGAGEA